MRKNLISKNSFLIKINKLENNKNLYKKEFLHQVQAGECPKPIVQFFLKFVKYLWRGFSFFGNVIFITLYINFTIENKLIFDKIFLGSKPKQLKEILIL